MTTSTGPRIYAAIGTAMVMGLTLTAMMCTHLSMTETEMVVADRGEIVLEEEFIEVMEMPTAPKLSGNQQAAAHADESAPAQPTPASGTDLENSGAAAEAPNMVTQQQESPVTDAPKPEPAGPSAEELKKQEEKRQAEDEVTNAFGHAAGAHNTANGTQDKGNAGNKNSTSEQGSHTGRGTGSAGGGWSIPAYGAVKSPVTGSIEMKVTIDRNGNVTKVDIVGGEAPAATNNAVRRACAIEVKSRKFTRSNPDTAPETSTAYITYHFR